MEMLYAPWREDYTTDTAQGPKGQEDANAQTCVFCTIISQNQDAVQLVLRRYTHCYAILNRYPYNAGHLLIIPYAHVKELADLSPEARLELMEVTTKATTILKEVLQWDGINIGINMGKAAGAGIPSHLHTHVLPRWKGDTNFLPTLAGVKIVSSDLPTLYRRLITHF